MRRLIVMLAALVVLLVPIAPALAAPRIGVTHNLFRADPADDAATFRILAQTGIRQLRVGVPLTTDTEATAIPRLREIVRLAKANDIRLLVMIQTSFAWGDRTDRGRYPAGDGAALYWQGYHRTLPFVTAFRDDGIDWEMENELNLLVKGANGKPLFGKGWTAAEFNTPLMRDWAQVLRGMSDAIQTVNHAYGLNLRRVLNTTSTNFGFLDFMHGRGVRYEVIDFHYYEKVTTTPLRFWGGDRPTFDLLGKLASHGKPIIFGEVNAAEIYDPAYANRADCPLTQAGYRSLKNTLDILTSQKVANIEAVIVYSLIDEPAKPQPENHFGLMYDLTRPKPALAIVAKAAGR